MATIVGLRREKRRVIVDQHQVIDVVDGQQRLTTLILLVLLPPRLNSQLGAKSPNQKKKDYVKTGLLIAQDAAESLSNWNKKAIETRKSRLLTWAKGEWAD